jgi:hypothetical protein
MIPPIGSEVRDVRVGDRRAVIRGSRAFDLKRTGKTAETALLSF